MSPELIVDAFAATLACAATLLAWCHDERERKARRDRYRRRKR